MEALKTALPSITSSKSAGEDPGGMITSAKTTVAATINPSFESECAPDTPDTEAPSPPTRLGQIGQGKGTPLTRSQRRRALCVNLFIFFLIFENEVIGAIFFFWAQYWPYRKAERFRQPLIRADPSFATNPFGTIRTHAQNTLVRHDVNLGEETRSHVGMDP